MNTNRFSHLIDETKKWLEETYFDQEMIDVGDFEVKEIQKLPSEINVKKSIKDLDLPSLNGVEVITLILSEKTEEVTLIDKLTLAIDTKIAKAKPLKAKEIEENDLWKELIESLFSLKHILISEIEFYQLPNLMKHYEKKPVRSILNKPLFLLADLKCYNQDVELKRSLWANLLREL